MEKYIKEVEIVRTVYVYCQQYIREKSSRFEAVMMSAGYCESLSKESECELSSTICTM